MLTFKEIYRRAVPLGLANMSLVSLTLTDMIMLGQHSLDELAAGSIIVQVYIVVLVFGEGIVLSFCPVYARCWQDLAKKSSTKVLAVMFFLITCYSIIALVFLANTKWLTIIFSITETPDTYIELYFIFLGLSLFPNLLFILFWELLAFHKMEKIIFFGSIIQFMLNAGINYLLIFGNYGFPMLGLIGCGIATLISSFIGVVYLFIYSIQKIDSLFQWDKTILKEWKTLLPIAKENLRIGLPIGCKLVATMGFLGFSFFLVAQFGPDIVIAHSIVFYVNELLILFVVGFGDFSGIYFASITIKSNAHANRILLKIISALLCILAPTLIIFIIVRSHIAKIFIETLDFSFAKTQQLVADFVLLSVPSLVFSSLIILSLSALRGKGITFIPTIIIVCCYWGIAVPIQLALCNYLYVKPISVWIGINIGFFLGCVGLLLFFKQANFSTKLTKLATKS